MDCENSGSYRDTEKLITFDSTRCKHPQKTIHVLYNCVNTSMPMILPKATCSQQISVDLVVAYT